MFGAYKKLRNEFVGVLTGKGGNWGGSFIRPEATGYGLIYYVEHVHSLISSFTLSAHMPLLDDRKGLPRIQSLQALYSRRHLGRWKRRAVYRAQGHRAWRNGRVALRFQGRVDCYHRQRVLQGGRGEDWRAKTQGWILVRVVCEQRRVQVLSRSGYLKTLSPDLTNVNTGARPWTLIPKLHIALPGATQNEVSGEEAEALVKAGVRIVAEGSNMVCFDSSSFIAP